MTIKEALQKIKFPMKGEFKVGHMMAYEKIADEKLFGKRKHYSGVIKSWEHLYEVFGINKEKTFMEMCPYHSDLSDSIDMILGTSDIVWFYQDLTIQPHPRIGITKTLVLPEEYGCRGKVYIDIIEKIK